MMAESAAGSAAVLVALRKVVRYLRLTDREVEAACGLSAAQLFVLRQLADGPVPSLAKLAERTLTDQSSVSTVVAKLVTQGLVERTASSVDRRRAELALTAAGRRVLKRAPPAPQAQLIAAIDGLPPQQRAALAGALQTLVTLLGADRTAPRMFFDDDAPAPRRKR